MRELKLRLTEITNQRPSPTPGFQIAGELTSGSSSRVSLLSLKARVRVENAFHLGNEVLCEHDAELSGDRPMRVYVPVSFDPRTLDAIEAKRNGDLGIGFEVYATALVAPIIEAPGAADRPRLLAGAPTKEHVECRSADDRQNAFRVDRDAWLQILSTFQHTELEVFELPVHRLKAKGLPQEALTSVHAAHTAFRNGDWDGTLKKCRDAFEAVATSAARASDLAAGFDVLWKGMLPDPVDDKKRDALNEVATAIGKFQHLGRHKKFPFTPVDRVDALLALRVTLSVFGYMGERT